MSKATLEVAIVANTLFTSKNGQDLKNRLEIAFKEGVINQDNPYIPSKDFNKIYNDYIEE